MFGVMRSFTFGDKKYLRHQSKVPRGHFRCDGLNKSVQQLRRREYTKFYSCHDRIYVFISREMLFGVRIVQ